MPNEVLIDEQGPITVVKINRPEKLNAWSRDVTAQLGEYLASLNEGDYTTRCIVLTGEGRAFCSGADVGGLANSAQGGRPAWRPPRRLVIPQVAAM